MPTQLRAWFDVMIEREHQGATPPPARPADRPLQIAAVAPILRVWASPGTTPWPTSTVTRRRRPATGRRIPPPRRPRTALAVRRAESPEAGLRQPDPRRPRTTTNANIPLPLDTPAIRDALNSPHPATALAVALVAFHALASRQVRAIKLTDIVDGRLTVDGRAIPLAAPVLPRLAAWLDHRAGTWPATVNPHLFVNRRTAPRLTQVSRPFPWKGLSFTPQSLREDRILDEVRATGGDIRRICELFDLSVGPALRYATFLDHTDSSHGQAPEEPVLI